MFSSRSLRYFAHLGLSVTLTLGLFACASAEKAPEEGESNISTLKEESPANDSIADSSNAPMRKPSSPKGIPAPVMRQKLAANQNYGNNAVGAVPGGAPRMELEKKDRDRHISSIEPDAQPPKETGNTEDYDRIYENPFLNSMTNPLSTFSIDVDTASYSNTRRYIESNQLPPADAVRIEELVNYFPYGYAAPKDNQPFAVHTDVSVCPWEPKHKLLRIGIKGKPVSAENLPANNLVFLLDVSGSMSDANKLPLLKRSLKLLVDRMRPQDHTSIVVYAGAAGVVLPPTSGERKDDIIAALDKLESGGSTAGGAGLALAYQMAQKHFKANGNNRIILATDGDFNVGPSSDSELTRMVEDKRKAGVFLTVLGFGMGNYKDNKMEKLADKGNGNYAYIDNLMEARKVLVTEMGGTLFTLAKDVKLQLEFNPSRVASYRLIGYENRMLRTEDFDDDTKDAGELGAGTTVTALYEVVPGDGRKQATALKYQTPQTKPQSADSDELLTVKLRYKAPKEDKSQLISRVVADKAQPWESVSQDFRFAAAVANFGMQLRDSEYKGQWKMEDVITQARSAQGKDQESYRQNFVEMARKAQLLKQTQ
jgi:Ca-activated chloride channel homolog